MQQQQPGTVTHSRISSLLISRRLTRSRVASSMRGIQFWLLRAGSGRGGPKIFGCALRTSGWTPLAEFLNPPLLSMSSARGLGKMRHWGQVLFFPHQNGLQSLLEMYLKSTIFLQLQRKLLWAEGRHMGPQSPLWWPTSTWSSLRSWHPLVAVSFCPIVNLMAVKTPSLYPYFTLSCILVCKGLQGWASYIPSLLYHPYHVNLHAFSMPSFSCYSRGLWQARSNIRYVLNKICHSGVRTPCSLFFGRAWGFGTRLSCK